jgi:hypothetical protein
MAGVSISIQLSDAEIKALSAMQISEHESLNKAILIFLNLTNKI